MADFRNSAMRHSIATGATRSSTRGSMSTNRKSGHLKYHYDTLRQKQRDSLAIYANHVNQTVGNVNVPPSPQLLPDDTHTWNVRGSRANDMTIPEPLPDEPLLSSGSNLAFDHDLPPSILEVDDSHKRRRSILHHDGDKKSGSEAGSDNSASRERRVCFSTENKTSERRTSFQEGRTSLSSDRRTSVSEERRASIIEEREKRASAYTEMEKRVSTSERRTLAYFDPNLVPEGIEMGLVMHAPPKPLYDPPDGLLSKLILPHLEGMPEWFVKLNRRQLKGFIKLLEMLDTQTCNRINFLDLRDILEDLDIGITRFEMECVFEFLQNDRRFGTIDFDEFLFCVAAIDDIRQIAAEMNNPLYYADEEKHSEDDIIRLKLYDITKSLGGFHYDYVPQLTNAQKILFTAIYQFSATSTLMAKHLRAADSHPYLIKYMRYKYMDPDKKALLPFVKLMDKMKKETVGLRSPYAVPLPFVNNDDYWVAQNLDMDYTDKYAIDEFSPICLTLYGKARLHSEELEIKEDFIKVLRVYANNGCIVAKLPDIHLIPQMRSLLSRISAYDPLTSSDRMRRNLHLKYIDRSCGVLPILLEKIKRRRAKFLHFNLPKLARPVPCLPIFHLTPYQEVHLTSVMADPMMQAIESMRSKFYEDLKKVQVYRAREMLPRLPLYKFDRYESPHQENFLFALEAYKPLELAKVHSVNPGGIRP